MVWSVCEDAVDIYERLMADHARQRKLIEEVLQHATRPTEAWSLLLLLQDELEAHQAAEEQTLYAEIVALSKDATLVGRSVEEHDGIAHVIATLAESGPDAEGWASNLAVFAECLILHLDHEETVMFRHARSLVSEERAAALVKRFESFRAVEVELSGKEVPTALGARWAECAAVQ